MQKGDRNKNRGIVCSERDFARFLGFLSLESWTAFCWIDRWMDTAEAETRDYTYNF